ncbi:hypothetical protein TDMWS_10400 [Thermodesulfomicrobium sp. WS]|uniref:GGDEF domain-containing protein n=1 Tax=Thermodesulfomicrobium sp. WS TaxID=3004129 RepID=UPI0024909F2E|nr:GGDEF domain-containing protein [Thermodesulfomicrobium sp. WS]BDV00955.1 hypothetical protein TDMWS_10400 [Thermodesulfomicrobium sp. WS]
MNEPTPPWLPMLQQFLEHSDAVVLIHADREGTVKACNLALMRLLHKDERPIGTLVTEIFITPLGEQFESLAEMVNGAPLPQVVKLRGSMYLFKMMCWHYTDGTVLLAERIGTANEAILQTMTSLTNELVNIGRDLAKKNRELEEAKAHIEVLSRTDPLTGLANRRYFLERFDEAISLARRHNSPLCVLMADLDHFKKINDSFGHEAGDRVLQHFATLLKNSCRKEDLAVRMGGEEFLVLLPHTTENEALHVAERLGEAMRTARILDPHTVITVSMGIARLRPDDTQDRLLRRADEALYRAKALGRDRVELVREDCHHEPPETHAATTSPT